MELSNEEENKLLEAIDHILEDSYLKADNGRETLIEHSCNREEIVEIVEECLIEMKRDWYNLKSDFTNLFLYISNDYPSTRYRFYYNSKGLNIDEIM